MRNAPLYWFGMVVTVLALAGGYYDTSSGGGWVAFVIFALLALTGVIGMTCGEPRE